MLSNILLLLPPLPSPWPWPSSIPPSTNTQSVNFHKTPTTPKPPKLTISNNPQEGALLQSTCFPSLAWANIYYCKSSKKYSNFLMNAPKEEPEETLLKSNSSKKHFNFELKPGKEEPVEMLVNRFIAMTRKTGIKKECDMRRYFLNPQDKKKRKEHEAAQKLRKRKYWAKRKSQQWLKSDEEAKGKKKETYNSDDDNWELPQEAI